MLLAAPLLGGAASADIIPPGHRALVHELVLTGDPAELEGWQLVAAPYPGLSGVTPVELDRPFRFSSKYGTRLFAVPDAEALPEGFLPEWAEGRPVADFPVIERSSVSRASPLGGLLTSLRLAEVSPRGLVLEVTGEECFGAYGSPLPCAWGRLMALVLAAPVLLGSVALVLLARRRRRRDLGAAT